MTIWVVLDKAAPESVVGYTDLSQALVNAYKKLDPPGATSRAVNDEWFVLEGKFSGYDRRVDIIKLPIRQPPKPIINVGGE